MNIIFYKSLLYAAIVASICGLIGFLQYGGLFAPVIFAFLLCYKYPEKLKTKYLHYILVPFLMVLNIYFQGGLFLFKWRLIESSFSYIFSAIWCVSVTYFIVLLFFNIKFRFLHLFLVVLSVFPPYIFNAKGFYLYNITYYDDFEMFLFFFMWQFALLAAFFYILDKDFSTPQRRSIYQTYIKELENIF